MRRAGILSLQPDSDTLRRGLALLDLFEVFATERFESAAAVSTALIGDTLEATLPMPAFEHVGEARLAARLLAGALKAREKGVNVLLYGPPGTGKTELAKTLARDVGTSLFSVGEVDRDGDEPSRFERLRELNLAQHVLSMQGSGICLFDEAEDLFSSGLGPFGMRAGSKVFMNRLFEATPPLQAHLCSPCSPLVVEPIAFGQGCFRSLQGIHDSFGERRSLKRRFLQVFLKQPAIWSALGDQRDVLSVPAGMDHAHIAKVEEQGKGQEPCHHLVGPGTPNRELVDEGLMLGDVLGHMRPHVVVGHVQPVLALAVEMQGIQFVIAHDGHGIAVLHHGAHQFDDLSVAGTGVDEVTEEGSQSAIGMLPTATGRVVAESVQRGFQPIDVGVDVWNDVVLRYGQISFGICIYSPRTSKSDARGICRTSGVSEYLGRGLKPLLCRL